MPITERGDMSSQFIHKTVMRNLRLEAAIWYLFTSNEFFEAAARECEETMEWFGSLAVERKVPNFGRNNQIYDTFKTMARDFRRGAELARLGDYRLIFDTARCVRGDIRGMMEQPLHSWMTEAEYEEFSGIRIDRVGTYSRYIWRALHNAFVGAVSYFDPDPDYLERKDDDDAFPGDTIVDIFNTIVGYYNQPFFWELPNPLPEYAIDSSVSCRTGEEVPWTGVWVPSTGLENYSLTFAVKGLTMQPAYRVVKIADNVEDADEDEDGVVPDSRTVAEIATWHPVLSFSQNDETAHELWARAG